MSQATECKKWTACSVGDAQAGKSDSSETNSGDTNSGDINSGGGTDKKPTNPPVVTDFIVEHTIMLSGINADTFNIKLNLKKSFVEAIVKILGVDASLIQNVRAISKQPDSSSSRRRFLAATKESCFVLYELVFDSKQKADAMEAKIEDDTGLLQTDPIFTAAFKSAMKQNNVQNNVVSSIDKTKPSLEATQETRIEGVASKSSSSMNNISSDASMDGNGGNIAAGSDETASIVVGVVFFILGLIGIGVIWYFFGQDIQRRCRKRNENPFNQRNSIHVTNSALVELAAVPPGLPPRLNPIRQQNVNVMLRSNENKNIK